MRVAVVPGRNGRHLDGVAGLGRLVGLFSPVEMVEMAQGRRVVTLETTGKVDADAALVLPEGKVKPDVGAVVAKVAPGVGRHDEVLSDHGLGALVVRVVQILGRVAQELPAGEGLPVQVRQVLASMGVRLVGNLVDVVDGPETAARPAQVQVAEILLARVPLTPSPVLAADVGVGLEEVPAQGVGLRMVLEVAVRPLVHPDLADGRRMRPRPIVLHGVVGVPLGHEGAADTGTPRPRVLPDVVVAVIGVVVGHVLDGLYVVTPTTTSATVPDSSSSGTLVRRKTTGKNQTAPGNRSRATPFFGNAST